MSVPVYGLIRSATRPTSGLLSRWLIYCAVNVATRKGESLRRGHRAWLFVFRFYTRSLRESAGPLDRNESIKILNVNYFQPVDLLALVPKEAANSSRVFELRDRWSLAFCCLPLRTSFPISARRWNFRIDHFPINLRAYS